MSLTLLPPSRTRSPTHTASRQLVDRNLIAIHGFFGVSLAAITQRDPHLRTELLKSLENEIFFHIDLLRARLIKPVNIHRSVICLRSRGFSRCSFTKRTIVFNIRSRSTNTETSVTNRTRSVLPAVDFFSSGSVRVFGLTFKYPKSAFFIAELGTHFRVLSVPGGLIGFLSRKKGPNEKDGGFKSRSTETGED